MLLYFAYGSNLSRSQMATRCPGSSPLGAAVLQKYRLDFTTESGMWGGGVADVVEDDGNSVWGLLYSVTDDDLDRLDYYEATPPNKIGSRPPWSKSEARLTTFGSTKW